MNGENYTSWVNALKEGDLVLAIEGSWSAPVIFLAWNGESSTAGYRSQHLHIPRWEPSMWAGYDSEAQERSDTEWKNKFIELEKHGASSRSFEISSVNSQAEKRYFPFPKQLLTPNQLKFIKLINKIKGYEY
tara:strand:- start:384 stop:779 length:396 start_codon:yes stop_codon:yes gene_type:complete